MFVDSHCHLDDPRFHGEEEAVVSRALASGVGAMVTIGTTIEAASTVLGLAERFESVYAAVGVHPDRADQADMGSLKASLLAYGAHPKAIALGETGLDFYREPVHKNAQMDSLTIHAEAARQLDLPLVIHTRCAEPETVDFLKAHRPLRGVIHCFTGSAWLAEQVLDLGFSISISGIVTFKNAGEIPEVVRRIPLDRLLIETDAPYLAPHPHRGKRNEPAFVVHTAQKVAELKGVSVEELARVTTQNFFSLFSKADPQLRQA